MSDGHSYLLDNCIGINNRRYYLLLWNTLTILSAAAIYPLLLLDPQVGDPDQQKLLVACLLLMALLGAVLGFFYTIFLWYAALKGLY